MPALITHYIAYDQFRRVTASSEQVNRNIYSFSYEYSLAGSLTAQLYPSGRLVNTAYDQANRATAVSGSWLNQPSSYLSNAVYAPHGALQSYAYGNGLAVLNAYNARLQPIERTDTLASAPGCGGASQAAYTGQNHFLLNTTFYWGYPTS